MLRAARWCALVVLLSAFAGPIGLARAQPVTDEGDVHMARGNPARTGEMPGPGPADEPEVRWTVSTDESVYGAVAVVDGVLYIGDAGGTVDTGGHLFAIDAETGGQRWRFEAGGRQVSPPALADGVAYIGTEGGSFFAVDAATGEEHWHVEDAGSVTDSPAVVSDVVYAGGSAGLFALDADSGEERWRFKAKGVWFSDPAVLNGTVYAGGDEFFFAVDAETGEEVWRFRETGADFDPAPAVADGRVYLGSESEDIGLFALDVETGEEVWRASTGEVVAAPAAVGGTVYVGDSDGVFYALDAATGEEIWRVETEDEFFYAAPTVADGVVYAANDDGLLALDAATGEEIWRVDAGLSGDPVVVGGVIYAPTHNALRAFATPGGPAATKAPTSDGRAGGTTYKSPRYGYRLEYDPQEWEVAFEDENPDDPYDRVFLSNGISLVGITGDPTYGEDELADCVASYVRIFRSGEGNSEVEPLDERGAEGEEDDRAWATHTYTHEFEDGSDADFVAFHECRSLGDELTLVVYHAAPVDVYDEEVEAREALLEGFASAEGAGDDDRDGARGGDTPTSEDRDAEDPLAEVETYEVEASHTERDVDYDPIPPVGGPHHGVWQACGFYDEPVVEEEAVHSLEHGAVWITYDPDLPPDEVELLEEVATGQTHVLVSPYPDLPASVVASAWGVQLRLDGADDPRLEAFVDVYQEGPQTPEPGAAC